MSEKESIMPAHLTSGISEDNVNKLIRQHVPDTVYFYIFYGKI
jgi:hypothetical protein